MELSFLTVLITVFTLVLLAIPGFIMGKLKMLPNGATKIFTTFLLYVCQPALTFMSFQKTQYQDGIVGNMLIVAGLAFVAHIIPIIIVLLTIKTKKTDSETEEERRHRINLNVVKFASIFGNVGYMGLPFLQGLFGNGNAEILIYGAIIIAVFNLLNWTVGIYMISGDKKYISVKKAILNPPFIALLVSLPLFLIFKAPISSLGTGDLNSLLAKTMKSVDFMGEMVTPISMTILGLRLSEMNIKQIIANKYAYMSSSLKLVGAPIIAMLLVAFLGIDLNVKYAIFFTMAMPSATSTLLFSEQFGGEPHTSSAIVLFSTILSILSIPLIFLLFKLIVGV